LDYIDEELGDSQIQRTLETTAQPVVDGEIFSGGDRVNFLQTIHLSTIDLLISAFQAPSISEGLNSIEVAQKAARIGCIQTLFQYTTEERQCYENDRLMKLKE
jgi:hypothetical protein